MARRWGYVCSPSLLELYELLKTKGEIYNEMASSIDTNNILAQFDSRIFTLIAAHAEEWAEWMEKEMDRSPHAPPPLLLMRVRGRHLTPGGAH